MGSSKLHGCGEGLAWRAFKTVTCSHSKIWRIEKLRNNVATLM